MTHPHASVREQVRDVAPQDVRRRLKAPDSFHGLSLKVRLALFSLLFVTEGIPISTFVHEGWGAGGLIEIAIVFVSLLVAIGYARSKAAYQQVSTDLLKIPLSWPLLGWHVASLVVFLGLSLIPTSGRSSLEGFAVASLWYVTGFLAIAFAACAFVPPGAALRLVRPTGYAWVYALAAALIARQLIIYTTLWNGAVWNPAIGLSWKPASDLTFSLVQMLLRLVLPNVIADRSSMSIGTPEFHVEILPWCTGFEGVALMLVFSVAWLAFFRREYRFPQALALIPAGMAVIWVSNVLRIWALILIGVAGAPNVAVNGFHSQAGWIAFNCIAVSFVVLSRRFAWFTGVRRERVRVEVSAAHNPTAAYLMPFVVVMAAGMFATAASAGFEWLYPLRVFAAAVTLWYFRSKYSELDWRFGWFSALAGIAVLALWLGLDRFSSGSVESSIGPGLAAFPAAGRITWLVFRTIGAVVTVPIAEELAFRGFLIRRVRSADFESLNPRQWTYLSILVSSVAFGLLHGDRWLAGSLAGLIYAAAFLRRGRIGDAVFAHALTNALLAAWVMWSGRWYLW
jgi:exosortase E/protease (VPEID-CTERM system)